MMLFSKIINAIKLGSHYMDLWPDEPILMAIFPEMRYKKMMSLGRIVLPPVVAFLVFWIYYTCGGFSGLYLLFTHPSSGSMTLYLSIVSVIFMILILLQLPLLGLVWFSVRATTPLNQRQQQFYFDLIQKLEKTPAQNPTMLDFITAINQGLKTFKDKDFLDRL